jgi:ABC-type Fe3+-citrate transport system substrate-binding protein
MEEQYSVNKDYKESFNQGYTLSKELGLKPEILDGLKAGRHRISAMKDGMTQYQRDLALSKSKNQDKNIIPSLDMDSMETTYFDTKDHDKDLNKDMDMDLE